MPIRVKQDLTLLKMKEEAKLCFGLIQTRFSILPCLIKNYCTKFARKKPDSLFDLMKN